ncbi:hypothetical protein [Promicromonospora soli]
MSQNPTYVVGQRVRYARKVIESDGETVRLGQIGTVIEVRDNTEADDVFGPVTVVVHIDGEPAPGDLRHEAVFRPEELEPVRSDDDVQHDPATVVEYVTGVLTGEHNPALPPEAADRLRDALREPPPEWVGVHQACGELITVPAGGDVFEYVLAHHVYTCPARLGPDAPA